MKTHSFFCRLGAALLLCGLGAAPAMADRTINFSSTLEAINYTSEGTVFDDTFDLELGMFTGGFVPDASNTSEWLYYWIPAPNSNTSVHAGSLVSYSTESVPFGGPANAFQGFVTLNSNDTLFAPGGQAYFWIFDERQQVASAEWLLLTNEEWKVPTVMPGEIELTDLNWLTSDLGTTSVTGSVNPDYDPELPVAMQAPHLVSTLVAVPEPGALLLALPAGLVFWFRRRR